MQGSEYGDEQTKINVAAELHECLIESDRESRPLRVYCGYDPRTSDLHIGHTITMRKLRQRRVQGIETVVEPKDGTVIQVGKRKFVRVKLG